MTRRTSGPGSAQAGFTLIELMVTLLVAAIIVSIAIPSYISQVRKSRRTEAKTALLDIAGREERFYNTNNVYSAQASDLGYNGGGANFPMNVGSGYYQVSVALTAGGAGVPPGYVITAVPITADQLKDVTCLQFTLDNTGRQNATTMPQCWQ